MDKIIENSICSCCNEDTNILKVVAGNDISVSIQLSVKENDEYVIYELDDIDEMLMNVVSPTGDRYEVPCFIVSNKISGIIDSNVLESNVPYGIELIWKDGSFDKRAYADDVIMFVNSSIEATDSAYRYDPQSPYEYNIIMENDTCYISIGQIPDVDMSNYVTQGELTTSLDALWQDCNSTFVDHEELADAISDIDLSDYVTQSSLDAMSYVTQTSLNTTLNDYVTDTDLQTAINGLSIPTATSDLTNDSGFITNSDLTTALNDYVTESSLNTTLSDYVTSNDLTTTLGDYVQTSALDDYVTQSSLDAMSYVTDTDLQTAISGLSIPTATSDLTNDSGFITLNDIPAIPTATSDLTNDSGFITNSDLTTALSPIESDITSLDGRVTTLEQSGSGVSQEDWDNANEAIAQELLDNRLEHLTINNNFTNYYTKTDSDSRYATQSWANNKFVTNIENENQNQAIAAAFSQSQDDLDSLDTRVTTLENNPSVPSNVVISDDGNEIVCLTQSQYDTLEQNQQLESDVFYYITDATSNYVTTSSLNTTLSDYVTDTDLQTAISGVTIDESNLVHKTGTETITGSKTFRGTHYFNGECQFTDTQSSHTVPFADNLYAIAKSGIFGRGSFIQAAIGQIIAPTTAVSNSTAKYDNQVNTILFQKCDGTTGSPQYNPSGLTTLAKIDTNGIYEGTTLLANKYVQSSTIRNIVQISQSDYNNLSTPDANTLYVIV